MQDCTQGFERARNFLAFHCRRCGCMMMIAFTRGMGCFNEQIEKEYKFLCDFLFSIINV